MVDFSDKDKHYLQAALKVYLHHLAGYSQNNKNITDSEFSELQDDMMAVRDLLVELTRELDALEHKQQSKLRKPKLYLVKTDRQDE